MPDVRRPIPIEHGAVHYTSRRALAQHLSATHGQTVDAWMTRLSRFNGDVARALTVKPSPALRPTWQGKEFPSRWSLAKHLATVFGGTPAAWTRRRRHLGSARGIAAQPAAASVKSPSCRSTLV